MKDRLTHYLSCFTLIAAATVGYTEECDLKEENIVDVIINPAVFPQEEEIIDLDLMMNQAIAQSQPSAVQQELSFSSQLSDMHRMIFMQIFSMKERSEAMDLYKMKMPDGQDQGAITADEAVEMVIKMHRGAKASMSFSNHQSHSTGNQNAPATQPNPVAPAQAPKATSKPMVQPKVESQPEVTAPAPATQPTSKKYPYFWD